MQRGKRVPKENPEAAVTSMPSTDESNGMLGLHVPSTESMDNDTMAGMGSPTAMHPAPISSSGAGISPKGHHEHHHHRKAHLEDPQPQGHDLRSHHGYNLRTKSFAK